MPARDGLASRTQHIGFVFERGEFRVEHAHGRDHDDDEQIGDSDRADLPLDDESKQGEEREINDRSPDEDLDERCAVD